MDEPNDNYGGASEGMPNVDMPGRRRRRRRGRGRGRRDGAEGAEAPEGVESEGAGGDEGSASAGEDGGEATGDGARRGRGRGRGRGPRTDVGGGEAADAAGAGSEGAGAEVAHGDPGEARGDEDGEGGRRRRRRGRRRGGARPDQASASPDGTFVRGDAPREERGRDDRPREERLRDERLRDERPRDERLRRHPRSDDGAGADAGRPMGRGRRAARLDDSSPGVNFPVTGKSVTRARPHRSRARALAGMTRHMRREDEANVVAWCAALPEPLFHALARALNAAPSEVDPEWMAYQILRTGRIAGAIHQAHPRDRQALAALLQCGGIAHADEMHRELAQVLGGRDGDWARTFQVLCDRGLVFASAPVDDGFYYLVPEPLIAPLQAVLADEMRLPTFDDRTTDVRVVDPRPFCPPFDFSLATLATWLDQKRPKLTQRQEIFKAHKDELDRFFAQVWNPDDDVFQLHLDFLTMHGMVQPRGESLVVNREVVEEWLQLEPEDQRDLVFRALDRRMAFSEFVLAAVHGGEGHWIPEEPLQALYRRWKRGEDWRERFHRGQYASLRVSEREGYSFGNLVSAGMLELGVWGQQKLYRLTRRGRELMEPSEDDGFRQFYLTPSYEIMAPAGLAPLLLFRVGEVADLTGCDRANTYKITEHSIARALENGWRRDELLDFLRENSQIGLPENVEQTLRGWVGTEGDVEFHELVALTVHRSSVRRMESLRDVRPFLIHRFAPGLYAVDRNRLPELRALLLSHGFHPPEALRRYPAEESAAEERQRLRLMLAEARERRNDPSARSHAVDTQPAELRAVPGSQLAMNQGRVRKKAGLPRVDALEAKLLAERAIADAKWVQMTYVSAKDGSRRDVIVIPERLAVNREGNLVLVATDTGSGAKLTWAIAQIERGRLTDPQLG